MPNYEALLNEVSFSAVKSSGPGGQHVNKTASKVVLQFDIENSQFLSDSEKEKILHKLSNRLTKENILILDCSQTRSQHKNKEIVSNRFAEVIKTALAVKKQRKKTRPTKASKYKRLREKKIQADKKSNRKSPL